MTLLKLWIFTQNINNPETGKVEKTEEVPANCWKFTKNPKTEHPKTGKSRIFLTSAGLAGRILEIPSKWGIFQNNIGKCVVEVRVFREGVERVVCGGELGGELSLGDSLLICCLFVFYKRLL
jgi:hypothetical protein